MYCTMMKNLNCTKLIVALFALCLVACEKPVLNDDSSQENPTPEDLYHLTFRMSHYEQIPFEEGLKLSRSTNITKMCTRIDLAIFKEGTKVKAIHQSQKDTNFGVIEAKLPVGSYQIVAIAHSGDGSATITSPEAISFPKNKLTDTFYYFQNITVGENKTYDLEMKRAVAMFRLITIDKIPDAVQKIKFYYTGGSSTFNAVTGYGCKNSRQTEERSVAKEQRNGQGTFDVFTFPHEKTDALKMTVSALNATGDVITEHKFLEVPVKPNQITQYKGAFFQNTSSMEANHFTFFVNEQWTQQEYPY